MKQEGTLLCGHFLNFVPMSLQVSFCCLLSFARIAYILGKKGSLSQNPRITTLATNETKTKNLDSSRRKAEPFPQQNRVSAAQPSEAIPDNSRTAQR
jgi:hypothetical protein